MATLHQLKIENELWWVARFGSVDVFRNRTLAGIILDCLSLGLTVEG